MVERASKGRLVRVANGQFKYVGAVPKDSQQDEPVYLLREADMQAIMKGGEALVLQHSHTMDESFWGIEQGVGFFPDEIVIDHRDPRTNRKLEAKLFLQRQFFSYDTSRNIWLRYQSVEASLEEEAFPEIKKKRKKR